MLDFESCCLRGRSTLRRSLPRSTASGSYQSSACLSPTGHPSSPTDVLLSTLHSTLSQVRRPWHRETRLRQCSRMSPDLLRSDLTKVECPGSAAVGKDRCFVKRDEFMAER